jgi:hypothetical protein
MIEGLVLLLPVAISLRRIATETPSAHEWTSRDNFQNNAFILAQVSGSELTLVV